MTDQDEVLGMLLVVHQLRTRNAHELDGHSSRVRPPARSLLRIAVGKSYPRLILPAGQERPLLQARVEIRHDAEDCPNAAVVVGMRVAARHAMLLEANVNGSTDDV